MTNTLQKLKNPAKNLSKRQKNLTKSVWDIQDLLSENEYIPIKTDESYNGNYI